jgi:CTP:phosphocholine cytidylyltransferase-like protein
LKNSYICSADNYFSINPFTSEVNESYYSALYSKGETKEWCMEVDKDGYIKKVKVGGSDAWYMLGHVFWDENFSKHFIEVLEKEYDLEETKDKLWEDIYIEHIDEFKMKINKYKDDQIYEFDTLDDLREFNTSYKTNTRSKIIKEIAAKLAIEEKDMSSFKCIKSSGNEAIGFEFINRDKKYQYIYENSSLMTKG